MRGPFQGSLLMPLDMLYDMAVSMNWQSCLWVSSPYEPYYLGSILGPLLVGNSQMLKTETRSK